MIVTAERWTSPACHPPNSCSRYTRRRFLLLNRRSQPLPLINFVHLIHGRRLDHSHRPLDHGKRTTFRSGSVRLSGVAGHRCSGKCRARGCEQVERLKSRGATSSSLLVKRNSGIWSQRQGVAEEGQYLRDFPRGVDGVKRYSSSFGEDVDARHLVTGNEAGDVHYLDSELPGGMSSSTGTVAAGRDIMKVECSLTDSVARISRAQTSRRLELNSMERSLVNVPVMVVIPARLNGARTRAGTRNRRFHRQHVLSGIQAEVRSVSTYATVESAAEVTVDDDGADFALPAESVPRSPSGPKGPRKSKGKRNVQSAEDLDFELQGRQSGANPWFPKSPEPAGSSKFLRGKMMKKTMRLLKSDVDRKLEASACQDTFPLSRQCSFSWGTGARTKTVVPRRETRRAAGQGKQTAAVLRTIGDISDPKEVGNHMGQFVEKLKPEDWKQVLVELGSVPEINWAKAMEVFEWIHRSSRKLVDVNMYHIMVIILGKARKMDLAESLFERMATDGLSPGLYEYTALIAGFARNGYFQKGMKTLELMKGAGVWPSVATYNVLIDGCLKDPKGFEIATSLLKQMRRDDLNPDRVTYTTMIIVSSRKGHYKEAISLFSEMLERSIYPDILTYNAVLNALGKLRDLQGMLRTYQSMADQQVDPDSVTFNILLSAFGRAGRTREVVRFYKLMKRAGVTPDVTTCSILVNAFGKAHQWRELELILGEMEALGLQPDLSLYNSLISIYGKAGRFEQVDLLTKSLGNSSTVSFDVITYNTLIDVYGKAARLEDVINWFSDMRTRGVKPDVRTFSALVHAYGRASQYDGVREVLDLLRADGSKPDLVFYHTVIFMFGKGGKYSDAWRMIDDMKAEGYMVSLDIYNSLILVFGRCDAEEAVKVFEDMIASGVQPNGTTFKVLIEVHARKGKVEDCLSIYKTSVEYLGDSVDETVLTSLLGACSNLRRMEEAEEVLSQLDEQHLTVSVSCYNWLILGYGRQGNWMNAEQVLVRMRSRRLVPNAQSYTFLLEAYGLCGLLDKAKVLSDKMRRDDHVNSLSAGNALLRFYARCGKPRDALQIFEDLSSGRLGKLNQNSYIGLISSYGEDEFVNDKIWSYLQELDPSQVESVHGIYTALLSTIPKCKSNKEALKFLATLEKLGCPSEICSVLSSIGVEEEATWANVANVFKSIDRNGFNMETQRSFQNSLIDALWWFGWELRALRVVKMGMEFGYFGKVFSWVRSTGWTVDMRGASAGAAQILLLIWIAQMRKLVMKGEKPTSSVKILVAESWQIVVGDNKSTEDALDAHLKDMASPFPSPIGQSTIEASGTAVDAWLKQSHLDKKLFLVDALPNKS